MKKSVFVGLALLASSLLLGAGAFAAEPTLQQVYQAAETGRLNEAQTMMREVLGAHPDSGKAHFVEAELLARQGQLQQAQGELATAERLAPGLPFEKPAAVLQLRARLRSSSALSPAAAPARLSREPADGPPAFPWGLLLVGAGVLAFIALAARFMAQRNAPAFAGGDRGGAYPAAPAAGPAYGAPGPSYGAAAMGAAPAAGLGARLASGLATGAAVGVGVAAGESLLHHFMNGNTPAAPARVANDQGAWSAPATDDELGGADFGVVDSSSWDDNAGGGSDWN